MPGQVGADVGVSAVAEPHAMHAFARQLQTSDLARLGRILDAINFNTRFIRHAIGDRLVEVGPFLVLDQNVADDLHLMGVGIRRVGHLSD